MLAKRDFPSPHPLLWQLMIIMSQIQQPGNWVGGLYCTSVEHIIYSKYFSTKKCVLVHTTQKHHNTISQFLSFILYHERSKQFYSGAYMRTSNGNKEKMKNVISSYYGLSTLKQERKNHSCCIMNLKGILFIKSPNWYLITVNIVLA